MNCKFPGLLESPVNLLFFLEKSLPLQEVHTLKRTMNNARQSLASVNLNTVRVYLQDRYPWARKVWMYGHCGTVVCGTALVASILVYIVRKPILFIISPAASQQPSRVFLSTRNTQYSNTKSLRNLFVVLGKYSHFITVVQIYINACIVPFVYLGGYARDVNSCYTFWIGRR